MKHSFHLGQIDSEHCNICKRVMIDHTSSATCEACGNSGTCNITIDNILMCMECEEKDKLIERESKNETIREVRSIFENGKYRYPDIEKEDGSIRVSTDIFNAKLRSIEEIRALIDADGNIPQDQKYFALAQVLDKRFQLLKQVIFDASLAKTEAENEQRAIQTKYNELSKKLRSEEREAIKLKDITYKPASPPPGKIKAPTIKKFDRKAIREASFKNGIPEAILQMMCVSKNLTVEQAVAAAREVGLGN